MTLKSDTRSVHSHIVLLHNRSFSTEIDLMEFKMKSKYAKQYSNLKKNGHHSLKRDEMSFRVHDPSILKSDANLTARN